MLFSLTLCQDRSNHGILCISFIRIITMKHTKKTALGFPLEYSALHEYYDLLSQSKSQVTNRTIETILKKHSIKTILDFTCGTGSQVFWLIKKGFKVTGVDISPALLAIAQKKAEKEQVDIRLIEGDMRSTKVETFDAVITIFNAIGHLTKSDFVRALHNIRNNLKEGGLYIFDIFNASAMTDICVSQLAMDIKKTIKDITIRKVQYSTFDPESGRLTSHDRFSIQQGSSEPKVVKGSFSLQLYTPNELKKILAENGFEILAQYDMDGSSFDEQVTANMLTVAKKC